MGKIKYSLMLVMSLCFGLMVAFNSAGKIIKERDTLDLASVELFAIPPSATISGTATVCLNDSPQPQITFTGASGTTPFTFTYAINGGGNQTVTTAGTDTSVTVNVSTNTAGSFAYQLVSVTDGSNAMASANGIATITVANPPVIDFSFNDAACSGTPVNFVSSVTGVGPFTYNWAFGNGAISTSANPTYIYDAFGCGFSNFTAQLSVTDSNGCTSTLSQTVSVEQRPNLSFEDLDAGFNPPFDNCGNNTADPEYTINVGNTSTSASCVTSYDIDWGDGTSATNITFPVTHTYLELGSFNMIITGYGDSGCNASETILIRNSSNPVGAIEIPGNTVNLCLPVQEIGFAIGSWGTNPPDTTYFVDFGDGTQENYTQAQFESSTYYNATNPSASLNYPIPHTYTESNCPNPNYTVTLNIATSCGETNLTAGPIIILKRPEVDFEFNSPGCVNSAVLFNNLTSGGYNQNCTTNSLYTWDFGDGNTSDVENPSHIYTAPGTYTVTLAAENFCGTTNPISKTICIESELVADFTVDNALGCIPLDVTATNTTDLSQSCGGESYLWEVIYTSGFCGTSESWSFTNGTDETSINPSFQFNTAGSYTLRLTATNACGSNEKVQAIEVKRPPTATIDAIADACGLASFNPAATVDTCAPATDTITYSWSFPGGTPSTSNQLDPGIIDYTMVGNYTISFSVTNSCGTTTVTEDFSINNSPTITNTDVSQTICSGTTTNAIDLTSDNASTTFSWSANNPAGLTGYTPNGTSNTIPAQTLINTTNATITLIYTVTPEISGCLGDSVDFEIIIEPAPIITVQPTSNAICQNGTTDDLTVTYQGTGTPVYQWYENTVDNTTSGTPIAGATSATFTPPTDMVGTTYYYVIITFSSGGCNQIISDTAEIEVANTTQVDTQPLNTQSICVGGIAEELSIAVSGGAGPASYQWFSNTTNTNTGGTLISGATASTYTPPSFTNTGTFYYYVEVSYASSGCAGLVSTVSEIVVVDDPEVISQPLSFQSVCQNTAVENLELTVSGGLGNISYQWYVNTVNNITSGTAITGANTNTFTPIVTAVGTLFYYCIVIQDISGCKAISAISEVEVSAGAQLNTQPISDELCLGETTPALTVSYTNGTGTATYQWYQNTVDDTATGTAISGATLDTYNPEVDTVGTQYYYAIITFSTGGCSEVISNTAEIIVNETPSISDATVLICSGNTFEYIPDNSNGDFVPSNTLYTWSAPTVVPAGSISGATEQTTPIAIISQFLENSTTNPATVTYTITPVSGNCVGLGFDLVVTVNPSISVTSVVTNNLCFQANMASIEINIVGGVPFTTGNPYQISWTSSNGFTSIVEDISNLEVGTYTLNIEDNGGCPYSETFTITEPEELVFSAVDFDPETISCFGANDGDISIAIAGGTEPYVYTWTLNGAPFSADEDISDLGPGDYTISVTDANNCGPIISDFTIEEPDELEVSLGAKIDVLCFGDATGLISVNVIGGRTDYSFAWTGPNGFSSTNQNLDTLIAGIYNLTVTDRMGCTDTLEVEILQNNQIEIDLTVTQIMCYGDNNGSITINSISGGIPPYNVAWSNLGTGNSQTNLSGGTYTITITDAENCERQFPVVIDEPPVFLIDPVVTQMSCSGENDASIALNFVGGIDPVTLVWDDDPNAGTQRNNLPPGTYSVTITDATPCVIQASFTIINILPLQLSANITHALDCDDTNSGALNLLIQGGTPPFSVVWSNGETTEDLENVPPNTYVVNVTDAHGCEVEGSWEVNRFEPLVLDVDEQIDVDCEAGTIDHTFVAMASGGVPPFQYQWSSGTVSGLNNEMMSTNEEGLVVLEVEDSQGCSINYTFNVETVSFGEADFDTTSFGFLNYGVYAIHDPIEFINLAAGNYESILWDFGDGSFSAEENPFHTYFTPGSYVITQTVTYSFGCVFTKVITLIIEEGYKLIMPDAFTPNNDGLNDFFGPVYLGLNTLEISIYDTWGSLIYQESGDSIRGWDGKVKDEEAENGNYYYTFSAKTFYGEEIKKHGAFVFIK